MTETKPDEILNGAEYTPDENLSAPTEQQEQTANDTQNDYLNKPDAPPLETPAPDISDTLPTSDVPEKTDGDGEVVIPSNVISGVFGNKQAAENEAEKQAAEQDNPEKDAPAQKRGGRPPKADKSEKETESKKPDKEKAEKPKRGDKPTNFKTAKHFKDKKSHYVDENEWLIFENTHTPIIDQDTFDNAQRLRGNARRYPDGFGEAHPLTGLMYWDSCCQGGK